jgi:putative transcriptional regulator
MWMIKYDRFFATLKKKGISQNKLMRDYGVDNAQLHRLRHNMVIKTVTIDNLCRILNCGVEDIMEYIPDNPEQERPE